VSGAPRPRSAADDPALDDGVLSADPLIEFNGWSAVARLGGCAVLPWRSDHLQATQLGLATIATGAGLSPGAASQVLVRIQKGRAATQQDLAAAWRALAVAGRLLVTGGNDLGIVTWVKRIAAWTEQPGVVLANHSRARVVAFHRQEASPVVPTAPDDGAEIELWERTGQGGEPPRIAVPAGVFGGGRLDAGTASLIRVLADLPPARQVLDLGCGSGHLGLNALLRWPSARAWFVDADARAVAAVQANLAPARLDLAARAQVAWWDVSEPLPASGFDLILNNPPCHAGTANDLAVAGAMFRCATAALAPGGRLMVVANRHLPYEQELARNGPLEVVRQEGGFKVLAVTRRE
jgi:16S rRNA (guanine1207-N2)-methyltransferase